MAKPSTAAPMTTVRIIAMILAHGALRLQARQRELAKSTEQSVNDSVLTTKGEKL